MQRIITATVQDTSGVLNRLTGLLSRRGFNIDSITVGPTTQPGISKMTFVIEVIDENHAEQIIKQLNKQIDVIKVTDIANQEIVARELALIKVGVTAATRSEIYGIITPFRAQILDVSRNSVTIEVTGKSSKIDALIDLLSIFGIKEVSRTGVTAFPRGN